MLYLPLTVEHTTVTLELGANFIINMIIVAFYANVIKGPMPGAVSGPGQGVQAPSSCAAASFPGYWVRSDGSGHWVGGYESYTVCAFMFHHCPGASPQNFRSRTAPASAVCEVLRL